jgi:hypothetical protein
LANDLREKSNSIIKVELIVEFLYKITTKIVMRKKKIKKVQQRNQNNIKLTEGK